MNKITVTCALASLVSLAALAVVLPTGSQAQTPSTAKCGAEVYSNAEQKYVGVPCAQGTQNASDASSKCGPEVYSNAEQKYVGVPCNAPAAKAEAGKTASCGTEVYSNAEQRYVGVPCH